MEERTLLVRRKLSWIGPKISKRSRSVRSGGWEKIVANRRYTTRYSISTGWLTVERGYGVERPETPWLETSLTMCTKASNRRILRF